MKASRILMMGAAALAVSLVDFALAPALPLLHLVAPLAFGTGIVALCVYCLLRGATAPTIGALLAVTAVTAAMAAEAPTVTIPYGDLAAEGAHIASAILVPLVLALMAKLTGPVGLYLRTFLGEQLIRNAVAYAVNAVEGAAKGKTLSVHVGSQVLAQAVQYALDQGAPWLVRALGGPEGIRMKVFRALDLEETASVSLLTTKVPPPRGSLRPIA